MARRTVKESLTTADHRLFARATRPWPAGLARLEAALPGLSRAADHSLLWLGTAAVLGAGGNRSRRAAVRGLLAIGLANPVVNLGGKRAIGRRRPSLHAVPLGRQLERVPTSSSFPSGHSASAAAFATGVLLEAPAAGLPVAAVAAAVAYSRVHTGVHFPGDVAAGIGIGVGAAMLTTRFWPVRDKQPARARPAGAVAPALPSGAGLVMVVNPRSGSADRGDLVGRLRKELPDAEVVELAEHDDPAQVMVAAAARGRVLGVAGGDGTVNTAACVAVGAGVPLLVVPAGTLNHFAADLGVAGLEDAVRAVQAGSAVEVTLGQIREIPAREDGGDEVFLNTASLGGYPEMVAMRERYEQSVGKWLAVAIALVRVLRTDHPLQVRIDGEQRVVWLVFAGNGLYHPAGFAPTWRERLDGDRLDLRVIDAHQPLARTRLVLAVLTGRLGRARVYEEKPVGSVEIEVTAHGDGAAPRSLRLATDGEVGTSRPHIRLGKHPRPLVVYRPDQDEAGGASDDSTGSRRRPAADRVPAGEGAGAVVPGTRLPRRRRDARGAAGWGAREPHRGRDAARPAGDR